jgi:hypothetical protein
MAGIAKTMLATAMLGAGMTALVPGVALADTQSGLANVDDVQTIVPVNVCNNDVPVNVLGVQVPVQDVAGSIPLLSPVDHGSKQGAGVVKNCGNDVHAGNG